jgi:AsmA family protein
MRAVRVFAWASAAAATLLVGAAVTLCLGGAHLAGDVAVRLAAISGWQLAFKGIAVSWGDPIRIAVDDLSLSSTAQDSGEPFRARRAEVGLDRAALWGLALRVRSLGLDQASIRVETKAGEGTGWKRVPDAFAELREIELRDGRIEYHNLSTGADTVVDVAEMKAETVGERDNALRIAARGAFQGKPFVVNRAEIARELLAGGQGAGDSPHPVSLEGYLGVNRIVLDGKVVDLFKVQGLDVRLDSAGEDLQQVLDALAVPFPRMPIYLLTGQLRHEIGRWQLEDLTGKIGDSDVAGRVVVESDGSGPPYVRADLVSQRLDLADLRGFYGGEPVPPRRARSGDAKAKGGNGSRVIPDFKIDLQRLTGFTADVALEAAHVKPPAGWGIERLAFALSVKEGGLKLDRLRIATAGRGELIGKAGLRPGANAPELAIELEARSVPLRPLLAHADVPPSLKELGGVLGGSARLRSTGASQRRLLASLDGGVALLLQDARLTRRIAGVVAGDVADAVERMLGGGTSQAPQEGAAGRVNCLIGRFDVAEGIATATPLILDTPETITLGRGNINLGDETITLEVRPYAKDRSRRPVGVPLHVAGTFGAPNITADKAGFAARLGAALGFGPLEVSPELKTLRSANGEASTCAAALSAAAAAAASRQAAPPR